MAPGTGEYVIGRPFVSRAVLNLPNGGRFTVTARGLREQNRYLGSVRLNGRPLTRGFICHEDIAAGGTLEFTMARRPDRSWATRPADRPYSATSRTAAASRSRSRTRFPA